jgi:hypothetical protein
MHLADELLEHLLGHGEVGDHAVLHRTNDGNGARRLAEHLLGALADGLNRLFGVRATFHADGHDRRLIEHDALAAHVDQGIGGTEVDGQVIGEVTAKKTEHA